MKHASHATFLFLFGLVSCDVPEPPTEPPRLLAVIA